MINNYKYKNIRKLKTFAHTEYNKDEFTNIDVVKVNIINKQTRTKITKGKKVKVPGYKKAIITLKKGQSIDLTTGI